MSGSLPGVEAARRRRLSHRRPVAHPNPGTRKSSSFCLYVTNSFTDFSSVTNNYSSTTLLVEKYHHHHQQQQVREKEEEEGLDAAAKEAKKRLDLRLQSQWKSPNKNR